MKSICILIFIFFITFSQFAFSKTLIVSDIDDTLKNAHVLNTKEAVLNAYQTNRSFKGMPELFHALSRSFTDVEFVYLTNAVDYLMFYSHSKFLEDNGYPKATIYFRHSYQDKDFKLNKLREIMNDVKPDQIIFFGDNAERDIYFYDQILKEFPMPSLTYIHTLYNQQDFEDHKILPLTENQRGYVTPLEVFYDLYKENLFPKDVWLLLSYLIGSQILSEDLHKDVGSEYFPSWMHCDAPDNVLELIQLEDALISSAASKIESVCSYF